MRGDDAGAVAAAGARRLPLLALLCANGVSLVGSQVSIIAIPWFVLQTTGSAARVGLTGAVQGVSYIAAALLGGVVVDRVGFKRASVAADLGSGTAIAMIPLLLAVAGLAFWQFLVLVFLATACNTPGSAARQSLLPDLAARARVGLERATTADRGIMHGALLVGPLLGGILIALVAASQALWVDAASFGISAAAIGLLVPPAVPAGRAAPGPAGMLDGVRVVGRQHLILALALLLAFVNAIGSMLFGVVLPVFAERVLHSGLGLGALVAADGAGAVVGTLAFGAFGPGRSRRRLLVLGFAASGGALAVLAASRALPLGLAMMFVDGLALGAIGPLIYTVYQERIPVELRGRTFGAIFAVQRLGAPFGALLAGLALARVSPRALLAVVAVGSLLVPLAVLLAPPFRRIDPLPTGATIAE
ncbi:MAG TPA: MFS transporter [Thermomicrobiaceae bacterium]|nr:MFS transporter [Thermomicrobiaceae bacterium]